MFVDLIVTDTSKFSTSSLYYLKKKNDEYKHVHVLFGLQYLITPVAAAQLCFDYFMF